MMVVAWSLLRKLRSNIQLKSPSLTGTTESLITNFTAPALFTLTPAVKASKHLTSNTSFVILSKHIRKYILAFIFGSICYLKCFIQKQFLAGKNLYENLHDLSYISSFILMSFGVFKILFLVWLAKTRGDVIMKAINNHKKCQAHQNVIKILLLCCSFAFFCK